MLQEGSQFNPFPSTPFWDLPNSRKLQTTTEMWLLTFFQTSFGFYVSARPVFFFFFNVSFANTAGKGEIPRNEQFLLFPQCFLPVWRTFCHLHQIWNCCLQTISLEVWNLSLGKGLKDFKIHIAFKRLWEKVNLLILSNFSFFHNVYL